MQINRLFEIIYTLMQQEIITANELAERLNVSKRTIYRDIDTLCLSGIPIYAERGKGGGIGLLPDFVLNKSLLSEQEQNEILIALHGLSNVKADETTQVLSKLSMIFNKPADDWLEVDFSAWGGAGNFVLFNDFKTAILERRIVTFNYYNQYGEMRFRRIEPMKLWFKSHSWYVKGFCLIKQDMRIYKMSRVEDLTVTDEHFTKRIIDAPTETKEQSPPPEQTPILRFRIAPEMTYRVFDFFNESSIERLTDGSFIAEATWPEDNWVYGFILSFGKYIEVLEPEHLRDIIKNTAQEIAQIYL